MTDTSPEALASEQRLKYKKIAANVLAGKASQKDAADAIMKLCDDNERLAVICGKHHDTIAALRAAPVAMRVLRGRDCVVVDERAYSLAALTEAAYQWAVCAGSTNPAFDMPGWFYSGSPYAEQIKALGVPCGDVPDDFCPEYVPTPAKLWRSRPTLWETYECAIPLDAPPSVDPVAEAARVLLKAGLDAPLSVEDRTANPVAAQAYDGIVKWLKAKAQEASRE
jgi:hypothetical protein